jgi:Uma2 family endonuclease
MSASTVVSAPVGAAEDRVVLPRVSWETYDCLLADDEHRRVPRLTYDQGVLELVTPSKPHERDAATITRIVDIVAANLGIPVQSTGATTFRRRDLSRGFEADASFYVQNEPTVRERNDADLTIDPPPDLILEMEMSRSAIDKLRLFASMGVPEVWRCNGRRVTIFVLDGEQFIETPASQAIPGLTSEVLTRFLADSRTMPSPDWFQAVSEWARDQHTVSS